jgi:small subunit ribosomal protein S15
MNLAKEVKKEIIKKHGKSDKNTGSPEAQIAMFTAKIAHLSEHLSVKKKDRVTQRSLVNLVGRRKSMLDFLKKKDITRYRAIIKELDIRK